MRASLRYDLREGGLLRGGKRAVLTQIQALPRATQGAKGFALHAVNQPAGEVVGLLEPLHRASAATGRPQGNRGRGGRGSRP